MNSNPNRVYVIGNNDYYQFGLGHKEKVKELTEWTKQNKDISVEGIKISLAGLIVSDTNGHHYSMGLNQHGECAIREKEKDKQKYVTVPTEIEFFRRRNIGIKQIFTGTNGWCVFWLTDNNEIYANGYNESHQLGVGDKEHHFRPKPVDLKNIIKISSADRYSLALDAEGRVFSTTHSEYGGNVHGNYKNDGNYRWKRVLEGIKIIDINNGDEHSLFLSSDGIVYGVGRGDHERLGNGLRGANRVISPIPYFELSKIFVKRIACGRAHSLAIDDKDKVWSWGCNFVGQCGDYTFTICTPNLITSLKEEKVIDIKCGTEHSYVQTAQNEHYLFGSNHYRECSLMDVGADSISLPYVINHIIKNKANGVIKEVHLGSNNTVIIVADQDECQDKLSINGSKDKDKIEDKEQDKDKEEILKEQEIVNANTSDKILELCEMLSANEFEISKLKKELSNKNEEIASLNEKLKNAERLRMKKDELENELQKINELRETQQKSKETAKDDEKGSDDDGNPNLDQILKKWKLEQYGNILIEEMGYDVVEDWKELTMDELKDEMQFKPGHAKRFQRLVNQFFENKQ